MAARAPARTTPERPTSARTTPELPTSARANPVLPAAARAYVDFVGSPEMQLAAAREVFRVPARQDLANDSLPAWVREVRRQMVVADVDWNLLAQSGPGWMRWWDQHVRGTGGKR